MILESAVTNVTNFGAFVDIGVHQDGLVHISMLADSYVKDPREVVKAGDVVKVKVLEVDIARQRIALTMRLTDEAVRKPARAEAGEKPQAVRRPNKPREQPRPAKPEPSRAMADAFARLKAGK